MADALRLVALLALCLVASASLSSRTIRLQNGLIDPIRTSAFDARSSGRGRRSPSDTIEALVQIKPPVTSQTLAAVAQACGVRFIEGHVFTHHAYLAMGTAAQMAKAQTLPAVEWIGEMRPEYKYLASFESWATAPLEGAKPDEFILVLHSVPTKEAASVLLAKWKRDFLRAASIDRFEFAVVRPDRAVVKASQKQIPLVVKWLAQQLLVLWMEPVMVPHFLNDAATGLIENGVPGPTSGALGSVGLDGGGAQFEIVALADSGLDWSSCFFGNTVAPPQTGDPDFSQKVVKYVVDGGDTTDATGHGTSVAGSIGGNATGSLSTYNGVAPNAFIYFTDIATGSQITGPVDTIAYLQNTLNDGVSISVSAFGSPATWYTTTDQDVDNFLYLNKRFLSIFPSGNNGQTAAPGQQITSPGGAKNVLTVGASQNDINSVIAGANAVGDASLSAEIAADPSQYGADILSPYSSRGPTPDGRIKPDVVAPGFYIFSASPGACAINASQGTSSAAGLVGGAAAIVRQYLRGGWQSGVKLSGDAIPSPSSALLKAVLINGGVPLHGFSAADGKFFPLPGDLPSDAYGFGRVQLSNTLYVQNISFGAAPSLFYDSNFVTQGSTTKTCFTVSGASKALKVTLVWTDPAGSPAAGLALINNLDLILVSPTGQQFRSNGLATFDSVNNVEQVVVASPSNGNWAALVHGLTLSALGANTTASQLFALVVSGEVADSGGSCPIHCPAACSGSAFGNCTANFLCNCAAGRFGVDCSLTACPNNCASADGTRNGVCDPITATCQCVEGFGGADCSLPANATVPIIVSQGGPLTTGQIVGVAIGSFIAGGLLCAFLGFFAAIQYLIWKRNQQKKLLEEGGGKK